MHMLIKRTDTYMLARRRYVMAIVCALRNLDFVHA